MANQMTILDALKDTSVKRRWALVVQGGGMRGVYSAGALACFDHYDLQDCFDYAVGSSAGAMNAAYFLADQPGAVNVYTSLLSKKEFVDLTRKRKKIDIDYMVDVALHEQYPVDTAKLAKARAELDVVVTDADDGERIIIRDKKQFGDIYEQFRATSAMPVLYDRKVPLKQHFLVDGGVSDLIPIDVAVENQPTHVIVIMTRPLKFYTRKSLIKPAVRKLVRKAAKYQSVAIRDMLPTNELRLAANIRAVESKQIGSTHIYALFPKKEIPVGTATIDRAKLEISAERGWQDADNFLHLEIDEA